MYTYKAAYQANMQYVFCKYTYKSRTKQHIYLFFCRAKVYKMKQNMNLIIYWLNNDMYFGHERI